MTDAEQIVERLNRGVHRFDPGRFTLSQFEYANLPCLIHRGAYGANGYVRMTLRMRRRLRFEHDIAEAIGFARPLSYIDLRTGWVGFDTGMLGDRWNLRDAERYSLDEDTARGLNYVAHKLSTAVAPEFNWSLGKVRTFTMALANDLDTYRARDALRRRAQVRKMAGRHSQRRGEA